MYTSPWNKRASQAFAGAFVGSTNNYRCKDQTVIAKKFITHLRTIKSRYNGLRTSDSKGEDSDHDPPTNQASRLRTVGSAISFTLCLLLTFMKLTQHRYLAAKSHPHLVRHKPIFKKLRERGMSEDISEHEEGERRYRIFEQDWRHPDLPKWLRVFHNVYVSTKFNQDNRPSRGNWTRICLPPRPGAQKSRRKPPPGLPRNFFAPGYLDGLMKYEVDALRVSDEHYPLQHTDDVFGVSNLLCFHGYGRVNEY